MKAQVLAEFISELTPEKRLVQQEHAEHTWSLYVDGSVASKGVGARLILKSPQGKTYK